MKKADALVLMDRKECLPISVFLIGLTGPSGLRAVGVINAETALSWVFVDVCVFFF